MAEEPENRERKAGRNAPPETARGSGSSGRPAGSEKDPGRTPGSDGPERHRPPALTERQRAEARKRREERRRRRQRPQPGNALSRGVRATGHEIVRAARFLARATAAAFEATGPAGRKLRALLRRFGAALVAIAGLLATALSAATRGFGRALAVLERALTPRRALVAAAGLAAVLLAVSQFTDFRATGIGQPGYSGIEDVTNAPRVDVRNPIGSHSVLLLIAVAVALAGLAGLVRTGRRRFALLVAGSGLATVVVALAIDLPSGLDTGDAALSYSGVTAILLSGFWLELAAGAVLCATGLLLWLERPRDGRVPAGRRGGSGPARSRRGRARVRPAPGRQPDSVLPATRRTA